MAARKASAANTSHLFRNLISTLSSLTLPQTIPANARSQNTFVPVGRSEKQGTVEPGKFFARISGIAHFHQLIRRTSGFVDGVLCSDQLVVGTWQKVPNRVLSPRFLRAIQKQNPFLACWPRLCGTGGAVGSDSRMPTGAGWGGTP
jgi:hypothetical protein